MPPADAPPTSDSLILREGSEEEVVRLLQRRGTPLNPQEALSLLANANCTWTVLEPLSRDRDLHSNRKVMVAMVRHPETPSAVAQRWIPALFWKELLDVTLTLKARPATRRWCEKALKDRLPTMGLGEKISLARRASVALISTLRRDKNPMVIEALLDNPRMTQPHIEVLVNDPTTPGDILQLLSRSGRWTSQRRVRLGLIKNPSTPVGIALGFLSSLNRMELQGLIRNPTLNHAVKEACRRLLENRR